MLRPVAALALVAAALVAGCGSDSNGNDVATNTNATASTNDDTGSSSPAEGRAAAGRGVRLVKVGDFQSPLYVTAPPGDRRRIFVVEQAGQIVVVRGGKPAAKPFLDIRSKVTAGGEQGLLSVAFPPDYAQSGLFYVYYTERSGTEAIWEYHRASDDSANAGSARLVLRMDDPEPNHNGGLMVFGPDKLMYVGTGDGGGGNDQHGARGNAQSLSSPLGKLLRIDPRASGGRPYTIPSSNPFAGRAGARGEIYAYGLRNPWRFSFYRANDDRADPDSARLVLRMDDPEPNHNGGLMIFGSYRLMYVGTGDGGGGNDQHGTRGNAQSLSSPLGKILRIDPRQSGGKAYTIPSSNPFVGRAGARGEIYSYGLRNPWRFSFDSANGDLTIGDVGQDEVEEIDFVKKGAGRGANFGWRPWEGRRRNFDEPAPHAIFPVITHTHQAGFCSITGGFVARDRGVPGLYGRYVYGDYCNSRLRVATLRVGNRAQSRTLAVPPISGVASFGQDASGRLYVVSVNGPVYRFAAR